jgi:two-component system sensor histidine kinase MprB
MRLRIALATAIAVAAAVGAAALATFMLVADELHGRVDRSLADRGAAIAADARGDAAVDPLRFLPRPFEARYGGPIGLAQLVEPDGRVERAPGATVGLPLGPFVGRARAGRTVLATLRVDGIRLRVAAVPLTGGRVLELARPLDEADAELRRIGIWLALIGAAGVVLAAALGLAVARGTLAPVRRLAAVVDHVTRTRALDRRVDVRGRDELSRLGGGVNRMLDALADSVAAQRRLVAEASHELRTPLTSLRADVGLLRRVPDLDEAERAEILAGLDERLAELTDLVGELVQVAQGDLEPPTLEPVRLDLVLDDAVARLRRHRPATPVAVSAAPVTVLGAPALLERAIGNLLENAAKWSPGGATVDVVLDASGTLEVRDRGPGIAPEEAERVFERFYRGAAARDVPGFGLGLAIVRRAAEVHGGSAEAVAAAGGGARLRLSIPALADAA